MFKILENNTGAQLYTAICQNPDEDTPRLMFADWLDEENVDPIWAQYIRSEIALENPPDDTNFSAIAEWKSQKEHNEYIIRMRLKEETGFIEYQNEDCARVHLATVLGQEVRRRVLESKSEQPIRV